MIRASCNGQNRWAVLMSRTSKPKRLPSTVISARASISTIARNRTGKGGELATSNQKGSDSSNARMSDYYEDRLSAERLRECYEIAPPRIRRYLNAETGFVSKRIHGSRRVLELGCGYGRAMKPVVVHVKLAVGCDTSRRSLRFAKSYLHSHRSIGLVCANASYLPFRPGIFDAVFCIQNGISAFGVNRRQLVAEAIRVTKDRGQILFSSYSQRIWEERLAWFRAQSKAGLVGKIDEAATGHGTIVCKDGFRATTVSRAEFKRLFSDAGENPRIEEIDDSSLFCLVRK